MKKFILITFLLVQGFLFAQKDSLPYKMYKDKIVLYTDVGYATSPFSIKYPFDDQVKKLKYRNNFRTVIGFGVMYKWFSLRLGLPFFGNIRNVDKYGSTYHYDLGVDFTVKKVFVDMDARSYNGYAVKNAALWNDTASAKYPNQIQSDTRTFSVSAHVWYFNNKHFKMNILRGKIGHYEKAVRTWYFKNSVDLFSVNNGNSPIVPLELIDSSNSKTAANAVSAFEISFVPGYAYVNRIKNWQFSAIGGLGLALQSKFYAADDITRGFLGLAPRIDFRFIVGYSKPKYFVFLVSDFDNKSIRFNNFVYHQSYYSLRLAGGVRLTKKKKKEN